MFRSKIMGDFSDGISFEISTVINDYLCIGYLKSLAEVFFFFFFQLNFDNTLNFTMNAEIVTLKLLN